MPIGRSSKILDSAQSTGTPHFAVRQWLYTATVYGYDYKVVYIVATMNFYVVLGQSNHPIANQLYTEKDIEQMRGLPEFERWTIVPVEMPWSNIEWMRSGGRQKGGKGISPYPAGTTTGTMRVPKDIAYQVQKYAVWLANQ